MGIFDDFLGKSASRAAQQAAADTYAKQQTAIADLNAAGSQYAIGMQNLAGSFQPYQDAGATALQNLMGGNYTASPGLEAAINSSLDANDRRMASRGMLASGNTIENTNRIVSDYTLQDFQNWQNQQNTLAGMGQNATGQYVNAAGQGLTGQLGASQTAFGGAMNAAGTIGQGMVAGAQAEQSALGNLMNIAGYLGGAWLGGKNKTGGTSLLG